LIANARFLSVFSKDYLKSENDRPEEIQIKRTNVKSGKCFYTKILKWQKVSHQEKKIEKLQICQNAPISLN
jgi:hypothetical protein